MSGLLYLSHPPKKPQQPNSKDNTSNDFTRSTVISEHPFSPGILIACFEIIKRLPVIMNESEEKSKYNKLNRLEQ